MSRCNWDAVWFLGTCGPDPEHWHSGSRAGSPWWSTRFLGGGGRNRCSGHVLIGTWTGPDCDLLCVRRCDTYVDAERWLAPSGRTILHAALRSLWLLRWSGPRRTFKGNDEPIPVDWRSNGARSLRKSSRSLDGIAKGSTE